MKKLKFTLVLALSMMILGASVAKAQPWTTSTAASGIAISATVKGCNFLASNVVITPMFEDPVVGDISGHGTGWPIGGGTSFTIGAPDNLSNEKNTVTKSIGTWSYGGYSYVNNATWTGWSPGTNYGCLLYLWTKPQAKAYNRIDISLAYNNGNDLMPLIRRKVTYGNFSNAATPALSITNPAAYQIDYLKIDTSFFRPEMDRSSGIATYVYEDQLLPLLQKVVIWSIEYEITINDETDSESTAYDEPASASVISNFGISIIADEGIETDPNTYGGLQPFFVASQKDFVFTATSDSPITEETVWTEPARRDGGFKVKDNLDGTYTITILKVNRALKVFVSSLALPESGETANAFVAADAVWANSGKLTVKAVKPAVLSIYTVTGQLYKKMPVSGNFELALPKGLYIVQLNGKSYKVVN